MNGLQNRNTKLVAEPLGDISVIGVGGKRRPFSPTLIPVGKEAMEISGHKTHAVFDRYHIVSAWEDAQNAEKLEAHLKAKESLTAVTGPS